jgi:hypothetical protein
MPLGSTSIRAINLPRFWYYSFHWLVDRKEHWGVLCGRSGADYEPAQPGWTTRSTRLNCWQTRILEGWNSVATPRDVLILLQSVPMNFSGKTSWTRSRSETSIMAHGVSIGLHLLESCYINLYIYGHASTRSGHPSGNHGDLPYPVSVLVYDSTKAHVYGRLIPSRLPQTLGSSQACSLRGLDRPLYLPYSFPLEDLICDFYAIS